jgi:hypothetical protein
VCAWLCVLSGEYVSLTVLSHAGYSWRLFVLLPALYPCYIYSRPPDLTEAEPDAGTCWGAAASSRLPQPAHNATVNESCPRCLAPIVGSGYCGPRLWVLWQGAWLDCLLCRQEEALP